MKSAAKLQASILGLTAIAVIAFFAVFVLAPSIIWGANATSPNSPQTYNTGNNYSFAISWTSAPNNMANTTFQLGSPSGSLTNYTNNTTGIVGYWRLNSVNGTNYTKDASGYGNDGVDEI